MLSEHAPLDTQVRFCRACKLRGACSPAAGVGSLGAPILFLGPHPGWEGDGSRLVDLFRKASVDPRLVRQTNLLKCRPPQGVEPDPDDKARCGLWLNLEWALGRPRVVFTFGPEVEKFFFREEAPKVNPFERWMFTRAGGLGLEVFSIEWLATRGSKPLEPWEYLIRCLPLPETGQLDESDVAGKTQLDAHAWALRRCVEVLRLTA